jgi:hypothetical protein
MALCALGSMPTCAAEDRTRLWKLGCLKKLPEFCPASYAGNAAKLTRNSALSGDASGLSLADKSDWLGRQDSKLNGGMKVRCRAQKAAVREDELTDFVIDSKTPQHSA